MLQASLQLPVNRFDICHFWYGAVRSFEQRQSDHHHGKWRPRRIVCKACRLPRGACPSGSDLECLRPSTYRQVSSSLRPNSCAVTRDDCFELLELKLLTGPMTDPWYEVVRPIWPEVVEITKSLDEDMPQILRMSWIVTRDTLPALEFDLLNSTAREYFLEAYLVAASQGGERTFTAFVEFLRCSFLPGSQALARELQRMWTRVKKKGGRRRSEVSLRKYHSSRTDRVFF